MSLIADLPACPHNQEFGAGGDSSGLHGATSAARRSAALAASGFDRTDVGRRFAKYTDALSSADGLSLRSETGSAIQGASFHSQIFVPLGAELFTLIRFSNFGDMATVSEEEPVPEHLMQIIVELLEKHGYIYVPAAVLEQPYTGKNPGVTGIRDWRIRYFDWV